MMDVGLEFLGQPIQVNFFNLLARKNPHSKSEKFSQALKALAIREKKVHIAGEPKYEIGDKDVFLDVEGIPDQESYFLVGLRVRLGEQVLAYQT